jgi:hypothetical protein
MLCARLPDYWREKLPGKFCSSKLVPFATPNRMMAMIGR